MSEKATEILRGLLRIKQKPKWTGPQGTGGGGGSAVFSIFPPESKKVRFFLRLLCSPQVRPPTVPAKTFFGEHLDPGRKRSPGWKLLRTSGPWESIWWRWCPCCDKHNHTFTSAGSRRLPKPQVHNCPQEFDLQAEGGLPRCFFAELSFC